MKTFTLPGTDLSVPAVILGTMRFNTLSDDAITTLVSAAIDDGVTFIDHAAIYGGAPHVCETRFGTAMKLTSSQRAGLILQTKCGIVRGPHGTFYDFSYDEIMSSVDASLKALGTDYIDILLLHRPDALVEPDEVARAFDALATTGKVRHFGVSNHTSAQVELLAAALHQPLVVNQVQISVTHCPAIAQGVSANMSWTDQSTNRDGGLLDYSRLHHMTLQAWSPYQNPNWTGTFLDNAEQPGLNAVLGRLAGQYGVTPMGIATAWLLRHPAQMQAVIGTLRPDRVHEVAAGADITLTRPEWYEVFAAAGYTIP